MIDVVHEGMTQRYSAKGGRLTFDRWSRRSITVAVVGILALAAGCQPHNDLSRSSGQPDLSQPATIDAGAAQSALSGLPVHADTAMTGYSRAEFGPAWTDDNSNLSGRDGCDERNNALRRGLSDVVLKPGTRGCVVLSGTLVDPYTGRVIMFVRGPRSSDVQVDHLVSEAGAWRTGAQQLTADQRRDFATDPLNLLAVDGRVNQAKGDSDAAGWLPERHQCLYVARQIAVKVKWRLWVTPDEKNSMADVLTGCPGQPLPTEQSPDVTGPIPAE